MQQEERTERRASPEIRDIFVRAYDVLEPFFDPKNQWAGQNHEHLAFRSLHESFPDLTPTQALTLVEAAKRVFASGRRLTANAD